MAEAIAVESVGVKIEEVERTLLELAQELDKPFAPTGNPESVVMAIAHRVRTLYRGYLTCTAAGLPPAAGRTLLRPMVEANLLLRYIREEPEWRSRLWHAESMRMWLALAQQAHDRPMPPEQRLDFLPSRQEIAEKREELKRLRSDAQAAGVQGIPPRRFLPDIREQVQNLDTVEAWQAYITAYMPLTHDQHVAHGSFTDAVEQTLPDGRVIHRETTRVEPLYAERLLASSLFASTLVIVSAWIGLGIEDEADRIRADVVAAREESGDSSSAVD